MWAGCRLAILSAGAMSMTVVPAPMTCARSSRLRWAWFVDAVVLGERLHHRGDCLAEAVADILDAARRVLDDVVQEADDLRALVVSGVTQDVGDRLRVGEPLARRTTPHSRHAA